MNEKLITKEEFEALMKQSMWYVRPCPWHHKVLQWLKGKLICSWKGHKKGSYRFFETTKTLHFDKDHEIFHGDDPDECYKHLKERFGDCGQVVITVFCHRCGVSRRIKNSKGNAFRTIQEAIDDLGELGFCSAVKSYRSKAK